MKYTILILISTTENWLRLTREERNKFNETFFEPLMKKYSEFLNVRLFDSESTNAKHTDFIIIETSDLNQYYYFWEEVRDSEIYTVPYFKVDDIIIGQEGGFKEFERNMNK
ncbi:darcynin family protein [Yeosuana marina]|uniref:darcynin family protein n=1 Tax=Yeosuana marina TaxID=1565536 RepID=UPI00141E97FA|nr:darcynin family protein [Yeosuana marina]